MKDSALRAAPEAAWKPWLFWTLKLGLTGLLLWLALRRVPLAGMREALLRVRRPLAFASTGLYALAVIPIEAARFCFAGKLLREDQPPFRRWVRIYGESRPFFFLLPASVGAEGLVWVRLRQYHWRHGSCGFVVLLTRLVGVGVWALVAALALRFPDGAGRILDQAPALLRRPSPWAGLGLLMLGGALLAPAALRRFKGLAVGPRRAGPLAGMLAFSAASALITGLSVQAAGLAAHTPISLPAALGFMAFFNFAMVLPVSLGGSGLQEALILGLGLPMGYPAPALVAFSAVIHLQRLGLAMVGLAMFLLDRAEDPPSHALPVHP